jgi:hypothetical protein
MTGNDSSLFATGVYGVVKTAACAVFLVFVADSLGRRWSLLWTAAAQGIFLYIVGIYGRVQPPIAGQPVSNDGVRGCIGFSAPNAAISPRWTCWLIRVL